MPRTSAALSRSPLKGPRRQHVHNAPFEPPNCRRFHPERCTTHIRNEPGKHTRLRAFRVCLALPALAASAALQRHLANRRGLTSSGCVLYRRAVHRLSCEVAGPVLQAQSRAGLVVLGPQAWRPNSTNRTLTMCSLPDACS
jgi:hypothetical protein